MNKGDLKKYIFMWNGNARTYWFKDAEHAKQHANFLIDELHLPVSYFKDKK